MDRTVSSPAATDLSLRSFGDAAGRDGDGRQTLADLRCGEGGVPAVATGRPLLGGDTVSFELQMSHSNFAESFSAHDPHDLARVHSTPVDGSRSYVNPGPMNESSSAEVDISTGLPPPINHASRSLDGDLAAGCGSGSDASTAASVSDFPVGMLPIAKPSMGGGPPAASDGLGPKAAAYSRSNLHVSKFSRRNADGSASGVQQDVAGAGGAAVSSEHAHRPDLSQQTLEELNDISCFKNDERYKKLIVEYTEGISFPLGEGGRELLRACLNVKGCKGRQLQGASVPALLALAKTWGLWDVALRIKVERSCGQLCPQHDAFVKFKANQSQMRKYVKKEYMVTERDNQGCLSGIIYDERRKITLGKEGRESLRTQLRRLHDKHAGKMDELLEKHGFKYSELRNATVQQLSRMAYVCNLWDKVVAACRKQEEKRDCRNRDGSRSGPRAAKDYATAPAQHESCAGEFGGAVLPETALPSAEMQDAWKTTYSSSLQQQYGDLPSNAYGPDDGCALPKPLDQSDAFQAAAYGDAAGLALAAAAQPPLATAGTEVRVKRELAEDADGAHTGDGASKRVQKATLSIEDLLSTLTVNWDSPTSESIEQFLQRQQEGHDSPVTEDNIFQAFSELVPSMAVEAAHAAPHLQTELPGSAVVREHFEQPHDSFFPQ
eukprot:Gregarina_sp_Pseudo_9__3589@NODE_374_length_3015_cov_6_892137_g353_i0_p1_GENE_NODE_374_length_3015_cov_6_892137_g353_i0NODE_374_length_3015_cov_6_892137_g353_i0_p1_ORF_typecomplete_len663_score119_98_NODE_374_length_3015_cov_6_892137_g353_i0952083